MAYATRYGSTEEVAQVVAETLRAQGLEVDIQPVKNALSLERYSAVVLGAPIYIGRWHKDAHRFLEQHVEALQEQPPSRVALAIFALGPIHDSEEERQGSREQLDAELQQYSWLQPIAAEVFGGRYDPSRLRFSDRLIAALPASPLHGVPASDVRDWDAIRAWARELAVKLQPVLPKGGDQ